jgi:hypothetical protein
MTTTTRYAIELEPGKYYCDFQKELVSFDRAQIFCEYWVKAKFDIMKSLDAFKVYPSARIVTVKCEVVK